MVRESKTIQSTASIAQRHPSSGIAMPAVQPIQKGNEDSSTFQLHDENKSDIQPFQLKTASADKPVQFTMADFHGTQRTRRDNAGNGLALYTTVGFEVDLLKTREENPLEGISHLVMAKSTGAFGPLNEAYQLETDAGNTLELVTPPFLLKRDENGVLDADDLKNALSELKLGYTGTNGTIGAGKTITEAITAINTAFNINLQLNSLAFATAENRSGDGVINDTHMSTRVNWGKLRTFVSGGATTQSALRVVKGDGFAPQINVLATQKGYQQLNSATRSRLDHPGVFNNAEATPVRAEKEKFLTDLTQALTPDGGRLSAQMEEAIGQLRHTLMVLEPRRDALIKQRAAQANIYTKQSLTGTDRTAFNQHANDVSFVKDTGGAWLKTDIITFIKNALGNDPALLRQFGGAVISSSPDRTLGSAGEAYDAGNTGWKQRLARMGKMLNLEGRSEQGTISEQDRNRLNAYRAENAASWSRDTFSLSDKVLGIRHDTLLSAVHAGTAHELLRTKNNPDNSDKIPGSWNNLPKVLVELRNIGLRGNESDEALNATIDTFIESWNAQAER